MLLNHAGATQIPTISDQYVIFRLDEQQFALHLSVVERIVRAVAVTPLPSPRGARHVPAHILGVVNVQGRIIPVVSMRTVYGLEERELQIDDQFIIASISKSTVALVVDAVTGVDSFGEREIIAAGTVIPGYGAPFGEDGVSAIAKDHNEIIILHNLDLYGDPFGAGVMGESELEDATLLEAALSKNGSA